MYETVILHYQPQTATATFGLAIWKTVCINFSYIQLYTFSFKKNTAFFHDLEIEYTFNKTRNFSKRNS